MPSPWFTYGGLTGAGVNTLDTQFLTLASMAAIPCTIAGTNALALTGIITGLGVTSYQNYMTFCGIAASNNSGATSATFGSLGTLSVFKDSSTGPVALTGNEIVAKNAIWLTYDSTLNSNNGGFHLITGPAVGLAAFLPLAGGTMTGPLVGTTITANSLSVSQLTIPGGSGSALTSVLSTAVSIGFTSLTPGASSDHIVTLAGVSIGDVVALGTPAAPQAGIGFLPFVSATNSIVVRAFNYNPTSTFTPTGGTYRVTAIRSSP